MFTNRYNGGLIHGYFDRAECKAHDARLNCLGKFKSYRAAQLAITRAGKP